MWPGTESNCRHEDFQSSALPTELPGQKLGIFLKSCRESRSNGLRFPVLFCSLLDEVDHLTLKMDDVQRIDFLYTRRASNVDLGKIVTDHVQANKVKAIFSKQR